MSDRNVEAIQRIYAAFGQGDIPTILANVTDDTEWGFNVRHSDVPWHAPANGKEALPRFFSALGENVDFQAFEPRTFVHSGDHVIADVHMEYTIRKTGKRVNEDALFWWTLTPDGKVAKLTHFEDTAQVLSAYHD